MASIAPTLTPRPSKMIGMPQPNPARMQRAEMGRKTFKGLNMSAMFKTWIKVSKAVKVEMVL